MKKVKVKNAGCAIFPSGSIHNVKDFNDIVYSAEIKDFLIKDWCADLPDDVGVIEDEEGTIYAADTVLFGHEKYPKGISLNKFFNEGYYHEDNPRTGAFSDAEYQKFEDYIVENSDSLFVGTCDYSSFIHLVKKLKGEIPAEK